MKVEASIPSWLAPMSLQSPRYGMTVIMALLLDGGGRVLRASKAARDFFAIDISRLPASLVEVTLESRLFEIVTAREVRAEAHLVHHRRTVQVHLVPGPEAFQTILFLADVTELRRLATVRQEFVANLVHELKTPITSLRLAAESLLGDPMPKDRRRFAERIVREADLMSKIIDNLRQLGDIETGLMALDRPAWPGPPRQRVGPARPHHRDRPREAGPGPRQPARQRGQVLTARHRDRRRSVDRRR